MSEGKIIKKKNQILFFVSFMLNSLLRISPYYYLDASTIVDTKYSLYGRSLIASAYNLFK
jgi:hypothetical protein